MAHESMVKSCKVVRPVALYPGMHRPTFTPQLTSPSIPLQLLWRHPIFEFGNYPFVVTSPDVTPGKPKGSIKSSSKTFDFKHLANSILEESDTAQDLSNRKANAECSSNTDLSELVRKEACNKQTEAEKTGDTVCSVDRSQTSGNPLGTPTW